jgi:hypothetical protein
VRFLAFLLVAACVAVPSLALADGPSYDDPGMHFTAPEGWKKIQPPDDGKDPVERAGPVVAFVWHQDQIDQESITITTTPSSDDLDSFEHDEEGKLRSASDGTFIKKREKTALANGMPAYFIDARLTNQSGGAVEHYAYLVIDTKRTIEISYAGPYGKADADAVKKLFASLYVVVYPVRRDR